MRKGKRKRKAPRPFYALPNQTFHDAHFWADWVELVCVGNIDQAIDRSSIAKRARSHKSDLGEGGGANDDDGDSAAEVVDEWTQRVEDWFAHLEMRSHRLKDAYPFEISNGGNLVRLRDDLGPGHKLYLLLLMAASLRYFPQEESDITASFEVISLETMKKLLPQGAEAHIFGANKLKSGRFEGDLWTNLEALKTEFVENLRVAKEDFAEPDRGDNGLDVVGWLKFEDQLPGRLAMFGQCACTKNWEYKQSSSSPVHWSNTMTFTTDPMNSVFIPLCLRTRSSKWHKPQDMHRDTLVLDRFRIISLLRGEEKTLIGLPAFAAVDQLLSRKEAVV